MDIDPYNPVKDLEDEIKNFIHRLAYDLNYIQRTSDVTCGGEGALLFPCFGEAKEILEELLLLSSALSEMCGGESYLEQMSPAEERFLKTIGVEAYDKIRD